MMGRRALASLAMAGLLLGWGWMPLRGGDWPHLGKAPEPGDEMSLIQVARAMDAVEERIRDDGVVVIKHPDVWGQSRMTLYRKDFERMMNATGPGDFQAILSARISRLDAAAFQSQTSLSASLTDQGGGGRRGRGTTGSAGHGSASAVTSPTVVALAPPAAAPAPSSSPSGSSGSSGSSGPPPAVPLGTFWDVKPLPTDAPFALLPGGKPFSGMDSNYGGKLGLDPPIFLDEKKRFFDHLNEIRRVNIGDDNADSAGYGLYLVRLPISIQPGECTRKGHGAVVTVTARHEFEAAFLRKTFKQLVINDLLDQLTPIVYELIRAGVLQRLEQDEADLAVRRRDYFTLRMNYARLAEQLEKERRKIQPELDKLRATKDAFDRQFKGFRVTQKQGIEQVNALADLLKPEALPSSLDALLKQIEQAVTEVFVGEIDSLQLMGAADSKARTTFDRAGEMDREPRQTLGIQLSEIEAKAKKVQDRFVALNAELNDPAQRILDEIGEIKRLLQTSLKYDLKSIRKQVDDAMVLKRPPTSWTIGRLGVGESREVWLTTLKERIKAVNTHDQGDARAGPPTPMETLLKECLLSYREIAQPLLDCKDRVDTLKSNLKDAVERLSRLAQKLESLQVLVERITKQEDVDEETDRALKEFEQNDPDLPKSFRVPEGLAQLRKYAPKLKQWRMIDKRKKSLDSQGLNLETQRSVMEKTPRTIDRRGEEIKRLQSTVQIERVAAAAFPSTRFGGRVYPVAPSDVDDVFLKDAIFTLVQRTNESLSTKIARATDIRSYLYHELEAAYGLLSHYQCDIESIADLIERRDYARLKNDAFPRLTTRLPGNLRGQSDDVLAILSWCVAVECGLLNRHLWRDMAATEGQHHFSAPEASSLLFYQDPPTAQAESVFERYVRARWPMIVFALDPFVDQQNIADAFSLRRDLQLAVAFSFATGKINFSQLNQFNRKIEQDSETIALNRTVTSFSYGDETFGWRFYPRYQNPPAESSNLQVIGNMLWRGGPGRNYQLKNAQLEAGQRELTAVIIMPSFLQQVRFEVTGNWFPLHDPDELKVPTARMIEQGRQVVRLKRALQSAELCALDRPDDLERLSTRVDQIESMLPMQTCRVSVPYENSLGGFQLFTPGTNALVPEVTGFEGVESVLEGQSTDIVIFGRHFSLHETKVVVGGQVLVPEDKDLAKTMVEIVSREVVHLKLPADVRPSSIKTVPNPENLGEASRLKATAQYVELYVATPTGVSNRLLIPFRGKHEGSEGASTQPPVDAAYLLLDDALTITATVTPTAGAATYEVKPSPFDHRTIIRIKPLDPPAEPAAPVDLVFGFAIENDVSIELTARGAPYRNGAFVINHDQLDLMAADLLAKLKGLGKLMGDRGVTKLVSNSLRIRTTDDRDSAGTTYNSLTLNLVLLAQLAKPELSEKMSAQPADGAREQSARIKLEPPSKPEASKPSSPSGRKSPSTSEGANGAAFPGTQPPRDPAILPVMREDGATTGSRPRETSSIPPRSRSIRSPFIAPTRPAASTAAHSTQAGSESDRPRRKSLLSRLTGWP